MPSPARSATASTASKPPCRGCCLLAQGGTAAGTGLNAPPGFDVAFCEELSALAGTAFAPNPSKFEGMAAHDTLVEVSGALNVVAASLVKIANDIRLLGSGPRCGLGELDSGRRPDQFDHAGQAQPDHRRGGGAGQPAGDGQPRHRHDGRRIGNFELNVAKPVLIHNLLQSIRVLADSARVFAERMVKGHRGGQAAPGRPCRQRAAAGDRAQSGAGLRPRRADHEDRAGTKHEPAGCRRRAGLPERRGLRPAGRIRRRWPARS